MRIKARNLALMIPLALVLAAMGGKGSGFERAPRVDKNFAVVVTDLSGNTIKGEKFSWEGRTHFAGRLGMASVNIPFERIQEIVFGEKVEKKVRALAKLREGGESTIEIDADSRCFGEAPFGSFMLMADEIRSISFKGQ